MRIAKTGIVLALATGLVVLSFGTTALAQDDEGYGYEFDDDPLNAGGFGPNDATIRVRPGAARTLLIRPRTQFVDEMLLSVENL